MAFFLNYFNKILPQKFFLFASLIFGILILFLTPPFQVPDEPNHFYRAWQVAEGGFVSVKQNKRVGGELPASLEKVAQPFFHMIWSNDAKIKDIGMHELFKIRLDPNERKFYDFNNTAMYSPICYFPEAAGIFILKTFNIPPLYIFYGARLFTLFFWVLLIYQAIRIIPIQKWLFTFLALLPMSLYENMSLSADVVTNAVCFLFIAVILKCAYGPSFIDNKTLLYLCVLAFFLISVKTAYMPLVLLLFIIPTTQFKSKKEYVAKLAIVLFVGLLTFLLWGRLLNPLYISYENYDSNYRDGAALVNGADMQKQIHHILHHGFYLMNVLEKSVGAAFDMYFPGYIGVFGWLNVPFPAWFIYAAYLLIFFIAITDSNTSIKMNWIARIIILSIFVVILFLVFLSQHLIWDPVGSEVILNIQGRYLISFAPLLFLLFYNSRISVKKILPAIVITTVTLSLLYSLEIIYLRYY